MSYISACFVLLFLFYGHIHSSCADVKIDNSTNNNPNCSSTCNTTCYDTSTQQCVDNSIVCPLYTPIAICMVLDIKLGPNVLKAQCYNPYYEYCINNTIICPRDENLCWIGNNENYAGPNDLMPQCFSISKEVCFNKTTVCNYLSPRYASICVNPDCSNSSTYCGSANGSKTADCHCGVFALCYDRGLQTCTSIGGNVCDGLNQAVCDIPNVSPFALKCYDTRYAECYNNSIKYFNIDRDNSSPVQYYILYKMIILQLTILYFIFNI